MSSRRYTCICLLVLLPAALASGCASLGPMSPLLPVEKAIAFQPAKYPLGDWQPTDLYPEDALFSSADGIKLHGWYVSPDKPRGVVLFCHGNAGNVTLLADTMRTLSDRHRLAVMSFDYRGYGRSEGEPSEAGVIADARAARKWLSRRSGVAEREIILMGQSLGGAVAVELASRDGARALVLQSTFTSLPDVGANYAPWALPHWNMTMRFNSLAKIKDYGGPVLVSHGDDDEIIPFEQGETLFASAREPKRFVRVPGGRHNDPPRELYWQALEEFLRSLEHRSR